MANLRQIYQLGNDTALRERVLAALVRKAAYVRAEDTTGMSAAKVAKRQALANTARTQPEAVVHAAARACANNATIQTTAYAGGSLNSDAIPDNDILYVIDVEFDALALVGPSE